jgi:hypothetical protein
VQRRTLKLKATFESGSSYLVSSVETRRALNTGFDTFNLHRPTAVVCQLVAQHDG